MRNICRISASSSLIFCCLLILLLAGKPIHAQSRLDYAKNTTGFWFGSLAPLPNTTLTPLLNTNLGLGLMYRRQLTAKAFIETSLAWAYLDSNLETSVRIIPWVLAYAHYLPLRTRISIFLKSGVGSTFVDVSPIRTSGSIPTIYLGLELTVRATPKLNVGLRFDYYFLYELNRAIPRESNAFPLPPGSDPRFSASQSFIRRNSHFGGINLFFSFNH